MSELSKPLTRGLFLFRNDLRTHDNPALAAAGNAVDELACVYCWDPALKSPNRYGQKSLGKHRSRFLFESLQDLNRQLSDFGQHLHLLNHSVEVGLSELIEEQQINHLFTSRHAGWYEQRSLAFLQQRHPALQVTIIDTHTLFDRAGLPCELEELPNTFSKFRRIAEKTSTPSPCPDITYLPKPIPSLKANLPANDEGDHNGRFLGGTQSAFLHLQDYFAGTLPAHYKETRNALDGWQNSCKFSPWLANGSLSARTTLQRVRDYESEITKNESTYWIYFELLWREYFQWYAHKQQTRLFKFRGLSKRSPLTSYYPERFRKWIAGNTPYPLVNACMNELAATGYLSNRGRQIVASCLVNELAVDWRYGAAYFEEVLLDYDVGSNWGNWQYIAGVGADPRGGRHFNLEKQTKMFDADGRYRRLWSGLPADQALDSLDAADWPI